MLKLATDLNKKGILDAVGFQATSSWGNSKNLQTNLERFTNAGITPEKQAQKANDYNSTSEVETLRNSIRNIHPISVLVYLRSPFRRGIVPTAEISSADLTNRFMAPLHHTSLCLKQESPEQLIMALQPPLEDLRDDLTIIPLTDLAAFRRDSNHTRADSITGDLKDEKKHEICENTPEWPTLSRPLRPQYPQKIR
ncbi:hypothetical protein H4Q26_008713 [Puccinia striiformis f. sp. tritici PST-130]|nr:hypothetical protein H4Q26_008713 [Puccinia striiformis f. sp. tritici PST-130]